MRFVFVPFGGDAPPGAAACDGLVPKARVDLSHWRGNGTPRHLKRDTSVEIALAFNAERDAHDVEVVTNNHFDADGVLACWVLQSPEIAQAHSGLIVGAAEVGDFDGWPADERGIQLEAAISALARVGDDRARYAKILPALDTLVPELARREDLWGDSVRALHAAKSRVDEGAVSIERVGRVGVIRHAKKEAELPGPWISKLMDAGVDRWLLAFEDAFGFRYRYELPRWAWADTVERPKIEMPKRGPIRRQLGADWVIKGRSGMTGVAYTSGPIKSAPLDVARALAEIDAA